MSVRLPFGSSLVSIHQIVQDQGGICVRMKAPTKDHVPATEYTLGLRMDRLAAHLDTHDE